MESRGEEHRVHRLAAPGTVVHSPAVTSTSTRPSLQQRLERRLEQAPDDLAFAEPAPGSGPHGAWRWRTFSELHGQARRRAGALAGAGVQPGDVCVLVLHSDGEAARALLGALLAGAVPLLVAPPVVRGLHSDLPRVLEHVVRATGARALVHGPHGEAAVAGLAAARVAAGTAEPPAPVILEIGSLAAGDPDRAPAGLPGDEPVAALQLTSGTTGLPRICVWRQPAVLAALDGMAAAMGLGEGDRLLNWTPLYHDMGLVNNFLLALVHRVPLALLSPTDFLRRPARWLWGLEDIRTATGTVHTWSPNFGYALAARRVRDEEIEDLSLAGVTFWNAAERIHAGTYGEFLERFAPHGVTPAALRTNFGCAENVGGATFSEPGDDDPDTPGFRVEVVGRRALHEEGLARTTDTTGPGAGEAVVGCGRGYPGLTIRILGEDGRELPEGHVGEVALDSPSRMEGYLEAATPAAGPEGRWLPTGDLGYLRGGELFWVGRVQERIHLQGEKWDPSDFEAPLLTVEGLREGCFAAFGVDDPSLGTQRLVIATEMREEELGEKLGEERLEELEAAVSRAVKLHLGIAPHEILLLPRGTLSKTSSGKRRHRFYRRLHERGKLAPLTLDPS